MVCVPLASQTTEPVRCGSTQRPRDRDGLCRRDRRLVDSAPGHQSPDDPRHLVGQRHPHQHRRLARQHPAQPSSWSRCGMNMALDDDAVGANDQKSSQGWLAHLRRGPETLLAPCRMLLRCQSKPRGEVARLAERLRWRRQDCDRSGDQGANAGHCHDGIGGQAVLRVLDDGDQSRCVRGTVWHDLPEFAQVTPERIDRLRSLADHQLADPEHHRGPLGLFTLHGNEPHRRAHGRFADRLSIGRVVLLALNERNRR